MKLTRRQFLHRTFLSTAALGLGGATYTTLIEPYRVEVSHIPIALPGWPEVLDGLTIAHLTDLHRSRLVGREYLSRCISRVNAIGADLVVFTGDYLTHGHSERARFAHGDEDPTELVRDCAACMAETQSRYGVFATLGNHDHWFDAGRVTSIIEHAGIPVLRNRNTILNVRGSPLPVVGLGDLWTEGVNWGRAFAGVAETPALVLMHNPDAFEHWSRPGAQLILAGHTHGGQVNVPFLGAPVVPSRFGQKYAQGLFRRGSSVMYVNRGLGVIWPGIRFNCRPEIAVFHLHSA